MGCSRKVLSILVMALSLLVLSSISISSLAMEPEDLTNAVVRDNDGDIVTVKWDSITNKWRCFKENGNESIHSGLAPNENGMWYCSVGTVMFDYTNFVQFDGDTWYVKNGKVATDFTGDLPNGNKIYTIDRGKFISERYTDEYQAKLDQKKKDDALSFVGGLAILVGGVFLAAKLFPPKEEKSNRYKNRNPTSYKANQKHDKVYYADKVGLNNLHYKKRSLLTEREQEFHEALEPIAERLGLKVLTKIRVADLVDVDGSKYTQEGKTAWHNIIGTHVDFVLVKKQDNTPVLLIELDDTTHYNERTQKTDKIKNHVFDDAGYKWIRVTGDEDLENKIKSKLFD